MATLIMWIERAETRQGNRDIQGVIGQRSMRGRICLRVLATLLVSSFAPFVQAAVPLGIYCAVHQGSWRDRLLSLTAFLGMAVPSFFLALLLLWGPCADCSNCPADFNGDCQVLIGDFLLLLLYWT